MKSNISIKGDDIIFYNSTGKSVSQHDNLRPKILVFDSGVGGLSISKHLEDKFHYADIIYIADNEFFPYGNKDKELLKVRVVSLIIRAINVFNPAGFIIACNTASTLVSDDFIHKLSIPCMRVLPPIKEAFNLSKRKSVLLIATPNTIESTYVRTKSIDFIKKNYTFHKIGVTELVKLSEKKSRNEVIALDDITKILLKYLSKNEIEEIDVVILGCTHFPSLQLELKKVLFNVNHWVDPAYRIVNQLYESLHDELSDPNKGKYLFCTSILQNDGFHTLYFNDGLHDELSDPNKGKYLFCTSILQDDGFHTPYFNDGFQ